MPFDAYTTGRMAGVVRALVQPKPFLLETFFRNQINAAEEEILFDVEIKRRRVAPFVAPHLPGRTMAANGYRVDRIKPPHIKARRTINQDRPIKRMVGEPIGGAPAMTPEARLNAIVTLETQDGMDEIVRRQELMAADALDDGIVTVTGDGYNAVSINYSRPNACTVTLSGGSRWGQAGIKPLANLETWRQTFLKESGLPADIVAMDVDAWNLFKADPDWKNAVDTTLRGSDAAAVASLKGMEGGEMVGYLNSQTQLWVYSNWYIDPADDTEKAILPSNTVLMGNSSADGSQTRGYGAIQDARLGYPAVEFAARVIVAEDPAIPEVLCQSAPLPILSRPAATFRARVA